MIEGVNITLYSILSILIYLFLLLYSSILIYNKAGNIYLQIISKIRSTVKQNGNAVKIIEFVENRIILQITGAFSVILNLLNSISLKLTKFEETIKLKGGYLPTEAVNISALTLRKLYDGTPQVWLVCSSLAIVVFYFILTIF